MVPPDAPEVEPSAGFENRPDAMSIGPSISMASSLPAASTLVLFDNEVAPSFFVGMAIQAGIASGSSTGTFYFRRPIFWDAATAVDADQAVASGVSGERRCHRASVLTSLPRC